MLDWFNDNVMTPIFRDVEEFEEQDSGWSLHSIINIQINSNSFNPLRSGTSYIPLPKFIEKRKACINVRNYDKKCFKWAVLAGLYHFLHAKNPQRVSQYFKYKNNLNFNGINFPVSLRQICKFETQNRKISINVFGIENKKIVPLHVTAEKKINTLISCSFKMKMKLITFIMFLLKIYPD